MSTQLLAGLLAIALSGCSFLGLADLDIPSCSESALERSSCQLLDDRDRIPATACYHWQCRSDAAPGCELAPKDYDADGHPDAVACATLHGSRALDCDDTRADRNRDLLETCDGIDNDCDGIVDEGVLGDRLLAESTLMFRATGRDEVELTGVEHSSRDSLGMPLLSVVEGGDAELIDPLADTQQALEYESILALDGDGRPCPRPTNGGNVSCNMRELSLSSTMSSLFGAAVSDDDGCAEGKLRIGVGALSVDAPRLFLGSSLRDAPNNLQYGVDITETGCPETGAQHPRIASLQLRSGEQGLAIWLEHGANETSDSCGAGASSIPVRAAGIWLTPGEPRTVTGTGSGRSQVIGTTRGRGPPALIADAAGAGSYLAAYGDETGRMRLSVLGSLPARPTPGAATPDLTPPHAASYGAHQDVHAISLAIAYDTESAGASKLAAAFRTGCGDDVGLVVSRFQLEQGQDPLLESEAVIAAPGSIGSSSDLIGPLIVDVQSGFLSPETSSGTGGQLVVWAEKRNEAVRGVRFTRDARVLDATPFLIMRAKAEALASFTDPNTRLSYVAVIHSTGELTRTFALCQSASEP